MKKRLPVTAIAPPLLLAAYLIARLFNNVFENDELQHLHVVWSWTRGLVQYKDVFDNHAPLYHLQTAGALWLIGAPASAGWLTFARALSLPVFVSTLASAYRLARKVFGLGQEEALAAACLLGLTSPFMAFAARPEPLWLLFFFLSLLFFTGEEDGWRRGFLAGLVNGAGAMVSLKTLVLLLPAQLLAAGALRIFRRGRLDLKFAAGFAAGLAVFPALIAAYFVKLDAFRELIYYTLTYNSGGAPLAVSAVRMSIAAASAPVIFFLLERLSKSSGHGFSIYAASGLFLGLLLYLYPVMEHQTVLPLRLMLYLSAASGLVRAARALPRLEARAAPPALFLAVLAFQLYNTGALKSANSLQKSYIDRILGLGGENGYVMDAKGESVFARRPFYYALELLAMRRIASGEIPDEIPARMRSTATKLLLLWFPYHFSPVDLAFFHENYLPLGGQFPDLYAAGKIVGVPGGKAEFEIAIPASYEVSCQGGGDIQIDESSSAGKERFLAAGRHSVSVPAGCRAVRLLWDRAAGEGT